MRFVSLSLSLSGCLSLTTLSEVPIVGGSAEARALVREALSAFEEAAGADRVLLTEVAFVPMKPPVAGEYQRMRERILLSETQQLNNIPRMVLHELCHALDRQEGLLDAPHDAFDTFGELLFTSEDAVFSYHKDARGRRSEALALVCERGPFGAHALSQPCRGEGALPIALADFTAQQVWTAYDSPEPWASIAAPHAAYQPQTSEPWTVFDIAETETETVFMLSLGYDDHGEQLAVDVNTGVSADGDFSPNLPDTPWPGLPSGEYRTWLSASDGVSAAIGTFPIRNLWDSYSERLLVADGGEWALVGDGCIDVPPWQNTLFGADERLWYAWGDGRAVSWASLPPSATP